MSKQVDERVVSMQFDNKNFESNVQTSLSTLDKLKQKLNLSDASKGLENINSAVKNVNMSGLSNAVETIHAKFSALEVMGVTALANITNSAVNAGKRITKSLTIEPISQGHSEYELKMNSIQTIMASTGEDLKTVKKYLEELNIYADKTIYSFSDMTSNIGKFTNAGVKLPDSVKAIQGISNEAAVSGANAQEASRAMYNFAQALSAGYVKLIDWKSIENANMATVEFKNELIKTAVEVGTLVKEGNKYVSTTTDLNGNVSDAFTSTSMFNESLSAQWMTTDVLVKTLGKYSDETTEIGKKAFASAQDVKTFTQLLDTLKEAAGSGWALTWELIFGDFEEAKKLFTSLSDFFGKIIGKSSDNRNKILEGALSNNPFSKLAERIETVSGVTDKMSKVTKNYGDIVDRVIRGEFGNAPIRFQKLSEAGYDWAYVQNKVNERLGYSKRYATDFKESQDNLNKTQTTTIDKLVKMSDAQLKNLGFTKSEIEAFRDLEEQSEKTGIPIKDLVKDMDQLNGRTLLINSFKNVGQSLIKVITAIKDAWRETFYGNASEEEILQKKTERLYNIIAAIHKFTGKIREVATNKENIDKLTRSFKGLFALIDIITTIVGGGFKLAFKIITKILDAFGLNILDITAYVGDAIVKFRDWLFNNNLVVKVIEKVIAGVKIAVGYIKEWIGAFLELPTVQKIIEKFTDGATGAFEVGKNMIRGLINGIKDGSIIDSMLELGRKIINTIKGILGIHSPSTVMFEIGGNIITGLINGVKKGISLLVDAIKYIASKFSEILDIIDWDKVFAVGISLGIFVVLKKLMGFLDALSSPLEGLGNLFSSTAKVVGGFSKVMKSVAFSIKAKAIKNIAISLGILVAAIVVLTFIDTKKLWNAVAIVGVLAAILVALAFACDKMDSAGASIGKDGAKIGGLKTGLIAIGASLLLLAMTVKIIGSLKPEQAKQGFIGLAGLVIAIGVVFAAYGKLVKGKAVQNIDKAGKMLMKLSVALLIMVWVIKLISKMAWEDLGKGAVGLLGFVVFVGLLVAATKSAEKNIDKVGGVLLKISIAMILMVAVVKLISKLSWSELGKGAVGMLGFVVFVGALVAVTKITNDKQMAKVGGLLLSVSVSMLIMAGVMKLIATMSWGELGKGIVGITVFGAIIAGLILVVKTMGSNAPKIAATILAMSVAITAMAGVTIILGLIDLPSLAKGVVAVGILGSIMALMIYAAKGAKNCKGNIIAMTVAIAVITAAVVALSFIEPNKLAGATSAMAISMGMFALMTKAASSANASLSSLLVMTVAVGLLGGLIYLLASLPTESVLVSSVSLSMLLLSLSASMILISKAGAIGPQSLISVGIMTLVIMNLGGILYLLSGLPMESTLAAATSLSTLLLTLSASMVIIGKMGTISPIALVSVGIITLVVATLAGVLYLISDLPIASTLVNAIALSTLLIAISAACAIISFIPASAALSGAIGLAAFIGVMAVVLTALGALSQIPGVNELISSGGKTLALIGYAIGNFVGSIIGGFGAGVSSGLPELGANLSAFMINATPFIVGIKMMDASVLEGVGVLAAAVLALTAADLIAGIASFLGGDFGRLGTQLSQFMINATPFILGTNTIDPASVEGAKSLAEMILILTAADILNGLTSWLTGGSSLADFGTQLIPFGKAMAAFSNEVKGIDAEAVTAAANAGKVMAEMADKLPNSGGVAGFFAGENDMDVFGTQLQSFGKSIVAFSQTVKGKIDEESVTAAANAGKAMTEMADTIPNTGGLVSFFTGDNDLATFGTQILNFGKSIVAFSQTVKGKIDEEAVTAAANAGKVMTEMADTIPNTGGLVSFFTGDNDLATFGTQIVQFGDAVTAFSNKVKGNIDKEAVMAAANAGQVMAELANNIPEDGWFDGHVSIDDFGSMIVDFGESIVDFSNTVSNTDFDAIEASIPAAKNLVKLAKSLEDINEDAIDDFDVESIGEAIADYFDEVEDVDTGAVSKSITSTKNLASLINSLAELDVSGISKFKIKSLGTSIKNYADEVSDMNTGAVAESVTTAIKIKSLINSLVGIDTSGIDQFKSAIKNLSTVNVNGLLKAFSEASPKLSNIGGNLIDSLEKGMKAKSRVLALVASSIINTLYKGITSKDSQFVSAGAILMTKIITGIRSKTHGVKTTIISTINSAVSAIREYYNSFYYAGVYLGEGLVIGINAKKTAAYNAGYALGNKAVQGEKDGQKSNSPSKATIESGKWLGEGLVIGIGSMASKVYKSGYKLGDTTTKSISTAISKTRDLIDGSIDAQPTIRPVLDLSDVKSEANTIGGLFRNGPSISATSNIDAINSMMAQNNQNGNIDDVVSAINKLRKDLSNVGVTNNYIDGVAYDDDSNLSNAVSEIVRAAKIERRR